MKKVLLAAAVVAVAVLAVPATGTAATITFSRSTSVSGSGGPAVFTAGLGRVTCTTHTVLALASDLSSNGATTPVASTNTSLLIRAANNHYSSTGLPATSCTYTAPLISGNATVSVRCDWLLTAITTTTGDLQLTGDDCIVITLDSGGLNGCVIRIGRQLVTTGLSVRSTANPTGVDIIATNALVRYTTNGRCAGDTGANPARQTETVRVATVGLSNP